MRVKEKSDRLRTVLFTIELFDVVTSFVVLTEVVFFLLLVKDRIVVPRRSSLGASDGHFALQNVDYTRNNERGIRNHNPQGAKCSECTFVNSVGDDVESFNCGNRRHRGESSARCERVEREQRLVVCGGVSGDELR